MAARNVITTHDNLYLWFSKLNCPKWTLYRGFHTKLPFNQIIYTQEDAEKDLDESFEELMQLINMQGNSGAQFTIYAPYKSHNKGASVFFGVGAYDTNRNTAISGAPQMGMVSLNEIDQRIAKERQMWEMERKIEDLETAERGRMNMWETLMEKVIDDVDFNQVTQAISGLVGGMIAKRPISLQGTPGEAIANDTPVGEEDGYEYNHNVVIPFLDAIRVHFSSDADFEAFIQKAQSKFEKNAPLLIQVIQNG